ncbi:MAG: sulfotransferase [Cyanobacteria bacterium P01_A01_bin.123]
MEINNLSIIIGTQKGGTTSLFSYLSQHPQISVSKIKETNFFSKDHQWTKGIEYYRDLWEWDPDKHLTALEASPSYTNSLLAVETVIQRIKTIESEFKFIYLLRNPVQKIESMRRHGTYQGWYSEFLKKETPTSVPAEVIERARYAVIVDKFVDGFSLENILLLKTEDLRDKPSIVMENVCNFLDLDSSFKFSLGKVHNSENSYRTDTIWHLLRNSRYWKPLKNLAPDPLKNKVRGVLAKPLLNDSKTVSPLTEVQKKFILDALSDDLVRLESEYNLDISDWFLY